MTSRIGQFLRFVQVPGLSLYISSSYCDSERLSESSQYDSSCENAKNARFGVKLIDKCRTLDPVRTPAVLLGMTGAVLVAMPTTIFRAFGFLSWLIGNSLWIINGRRTDDRYMVVMFGFYLLTAFVGLGNIVWGCW